MNNNEEEFKKKLSPVYKPIEITRKKLNKEKSLISFVGAPWTLLVYMLGIKKSKNDTLPKTFNFIPLFFSFFTNNKKHYRSSLSAT